MPPAISLRDALIATAIAASWGFHFVVIRAGALEVEPLTLLTLRFLLASLIFLPFAGRIAWPQFRAVSVYAFFYLVLHIGILFVALKYLEAGLTSLIMQLCTPFILVLGWVFFGEKFGLKTGSGLVLALIGVGCIVYRPFDPHFPLFAAALTIISAFCWAVGALKMRAIGDISFSSMTFYSHIFALPFAALMMTIFEGDPMPAIWTADHLILAGVLAYQVILMSLSLYWWRGLMQRNPAYLVSPFTLFVPIFGLLSSVILMGESLTAHALAGGALVIAGVGIISLRQLQKGLKKTEPQRTQSRAKLKK